jgi:hypothetical protein
MTPFSVFRKNSRYICCFITVVGLLMLSEKIISLYARPNTLPVCPMADVTGLVQDGQGIQLLEPKTPIQREMAGGETHSYQIILDKDQYLHAVVDQRGVDVAVTLFGPGGEQILVIDSPNGNLGPDLFS